MKKNNQAGTGGVPGDIAGDTPSTSSPYRTQMLVSPTGEIIGMEVALQVQSLQTCV
jgi:hypothetical protein